MRLPNATVENGNPEKSADTKFYCSNLLIGAFQAALYFIRICLSSMVTRVTKRFPGASEAKKLSGLGDLG